MVLSDGMVHFLMIEKILTNLPNLSCGFKIISVYQWVVRIILSEDINNVKF